MLEQKTSAEILEDWIKHERDAFNPHPGLKKPIQFSELLPGSPSCPLKLLVKKLHPDAKLPTKAHKEDAGWDLYALEDFEVKGYRIIYPNQAMRDNHSEVQGALFPQVRTGLALKVPDGHFGLVCDRSSIGKRGIKVLGGVIDQYRGEILVMLGAFSSRESFKAGDKIAQLVILPVPNVEVEEVDELPDTERGEKGFGSSGE